MTLSTSDLTGVKARQQQAWASGDYTHVGSRIVLSSERLADAADLRAGSPVLDVACGSGNATLAAARNGARAIGIDFVEHLLDDARSRAAAERLDAEFRLGDVEDLPVEDDSSDAVLSVFGAMFAPDHERTASEMLRVARPGGTIALASWTPHGFIGQMFRVVGQYVPPPPGVASPLLWGTEQHLADLFGAEALTIWSTEQVQTLRFSSAEEFVTYFRRWYGPTLKAFDALDDAGQTALTTDLVELAQKFDRFGDGAGVCLPGSYLQSVVTLR